MSDSGRTLGQSCGLCGAKHSESDNLTCKLNLAAELEALRMEKEGYRKAYELMQKGMESQCELMDGLKQELRELQAKIEASREKARVRGRASKAKRRLERLAAGLCQKCGRTPKTGCTLCLWCLAANNESGRKARLKKAEDAGIP